MLYHKDRFQSAHNLLMYYKARPVAILPLAFRQIKNRKEAYSHFGGSFGGICFRRKVGLEHMLKITGLMLDYLSRQKVDQVTITLPPALYLKAQDDRLSYCLYYHGLRSVSEDILHVLKIPNRTYDIIDFYDSKLRNETRNALEKFTVYKMASAESFFPILKEDKSRHQAVATHSLEELVYLQKNLPKHIRIDLVLDNDTLMPVAGICYFETSPTTISTFYLAQRTSFIGKNPIAAAIYEGLTDFQEKYTYLDFGGSSVNSVIQNIGVSKYKENFGSFGSIRRVYKKEL
jgi:hypothetical protein